MKFMNELSKYFLQLLFNWIIFISFFPPLENFYGNYSYFGRIIGRSVSQREMQIAASIHLNMNMQMLRFSQLKPSVILARRRRNASNDRIESKERNLQIFSLHLFAITDM